MLFWLIFRNWSKLTKNDYCKVLRILKVVYFKSFAPLVTETDGRGKRVHIQTIGQTFMPFILKVLSVIGFVCKTVIQ